MLRVCGRGAREWSKEECLSEQRCTVTSCTTGQGALDLIEQHGEGAFDVLLLDICMPRMDGYQVATEIRCGQSPPCGDETPSRGEWGSGNIKLIPVLDLQANRGGSRMEAAANHCSHGHDAHSGQGEVAADWDEPFSV